MDGPAIAQNQVNHKSDQKNWQPRYNWNIVESGIKHPNPNPLPWTSNRDSEIPATRLGASWTRHLCYGPAIAQNQVNHKSVILNQM
jgi:hypothetical protein